MTTVRSLLEIRDLYSDMYDDPSYSFHSNSSAEPSTSYLHEFWTWLVGIYSHYHTST
jgi:hypothetical protein